MPHPQETAGAAPDATAEASRRAAEIPVSAVPGIEWPAVPGARAAPVLALLSQLEESQWWAPAQIREWQTRQLGALLEHAREQVPFYRERLAAAGLGAGRPPAPEAWSRLAPLTRRELQSEPLRARRLPPAHGGTSELRTSGSTGEPVVVTGTAVTALFWRAFTLRDHLWHRRDLGGRLAAVRPTGEPFRAHHHAGWGAATDGLFRTGPSGVLGIGTDVSEQARWLLEFDPDYLLTHPSNLVALAAHFHRHALRLPRLREVRTLGETLGPAAVQACAEVFRVPLVDGYSSQEVGHIALQCPDVPGTYHVQSENALVEILDADGRPCPPGRVGRVVVTPLHNFAMPLLRYAIRDYAEPAPPCPCGRGLAAIRRILGRERNMLVMPSGERRWPMTGFMGYAAIAPVRQYQLIQHDRGHIEARFAVARPLSAEEERALAAHVQRSLGHPFALRIVYVDEIPRTPGGKFEEFVSHAQ